MRTRGALQSFVETHNMCLIAETQAGKSCAWRGIIPLNLGPVGVTGGEPANATCVPRPIWCWAVGTRLQDFTTGSWGLFSNP